MTQSRDGAGQGAGASAWMPPQPKPQAADPFATGEVARLPAPPIPLPRPAADAPVSASDTDEMQVLLRKIAAQIAEAEKRQGAALDGMRTRLNDLAGQTETTKEQAPQTLQPGLTAIEKRISEMAQTVQAVSRDIKASAHPAVSAPQQTVSAAPAADGPAAPKVHARGFGLGQVRGSNEAASAAPKSAPPLDPNAIAQPPALSSATRPQGLAGQPATPVIKSGAIKSGAFAQSSDATGNWDQESADALAKIFADEEAEAAHAGAGLSSQPPALTSGQKAAFPSIAQTAIAQPAVAPPVARQPMAAPAPAPANATAAAPSPAPRAPAPPAPAARPAAPTPAPTPAALKPAAAAPVTPTAAITKHPVTTSASVPAPKAAAPSLPASPPATALPAPAVAASMSGPDRDWLNSRFADIASQLTRSLQESRPDQAFSAIGQRFDKLEASLATVVTAVRSGAPQSDGRVAMQSLETQVTALKSQVDATVSRLEGLDGIKGELGALAQRLGILERLEKAQAATDGQVADTRGDLGKLARLIEDNHRSHTALTTKAAAPAVADPRIDMLHQMLESQLVERRDGETATVAVLQAIQGSIDQLTGRIHQFEETVASVVMGGIDPGAEQAPVAPAHPVRPAHMAAPIAAAGLPESQAHSAPSDAFEPEERTQFARRGAPAKAPVRHDEIAAPAPERASKRAVAEAPVPQAEAAIPRTRRGVGAILAGGMPQMAEQPDVAAKAPGTRPGERLSAPEARPETRPEPREDMIQVARRSTGAAGKPDVLVTDESDVDVETIASRLPGQKRPKAKAARGGFFTFEKAGARPVYVVGLVALLAAGAGMLYGSMTERSQQPVPVMPGRIDKQMQPPPKLGALQEPKSSDVALLPNVEIGQRNETSSNAEATDMRAADAKEAALSGFKRGNDGDATAMLTGSSTTPAAPQAGDAGNLTTGILIDSGAPMPSARDLQRYSQEQRMARISSHLGDKAVQKTENDHATPVSLTPDARRPDVAPSAPAAQTIAPVVPGPASANNASGLPPALIGPMSLRVAAAKGDPSAEFEVASRFAQGKGVPKDFAAAAEWYQRSASKGSAPAQYRLGGLFERGIGVPADGTRARAWYKRAAEQGHTKAMHNLAVMLTQRDAGEPDYATASTWFTRAASYGLPDSQFNLGILHENGMGVPRSATEAYKWYALASEKGDPEAAKRRTAIAAKLAPAELEAARQLVARWRPQPSDASANDPLMAGQAWRNRNGDMPGGAQSTPAAAQAGSNPTRGAALVPSVRAPQQEAEIIDLTEAAIEAQQKSENAVQRVAIDAETAKRPQAMADATSTDAAGIVNRKRRVAKAQSPADVEKMLAQYGYDAKALKKARPGGEPGDPQQASTTTE